MDWLHSPPFVAPKRDAAEKTSGDWGERDSQSYQPGRYIELIAKLFPGEGKKQEQENQSDDILLQVRAMSKERQTELVKDLIRHLAEGQSSATQPVGGNPAPTKNSDTGRNNSKAKEKKQKKVLRPKKRQRKIKTQQPGPKSKRVKKETGSRKDEIAQLQPPEEVCGHINREGRPCQRKEGPLLCPYHGSQR